MVSPTWNSKHCSKRVKAVHAVCSIEDSGKVRDILKRIYRSKPRKDYPEGVQWRAIENTADPDFPAPPLARMIAERMKYKQANFLRGVRRTTYNHTSNLHARLDTFPHQVLARIMYNWRSSKNLDRRLFFLVEQEYEGAPVQFSYSADLEDEVDAILPVLPLVILVGRLGLSPATSNPGRSPGFECPGVVSPIVHSRLPWLPLRQSQRLCRPPAS
jgi:hypothetical protein